MTPRKRWQFSIRCLLLATAVCAAVLAGVQSLGLVSLVFLVSLAVFWAAAVLAVAWLTAHASRAMDHLAVPLIAFNVINWGAWGLARLALYFMVDGLRGRHDVAPWGLFLLQAEQIHVFELIAVACMCATVLAAWKKNKAWLFTCGMTIVLLWLVVLGFGFVTASVHLIVLP